MNSHQPHSERSVGANQAEKGGGGKDETDRLEKAGRKDWASGSSSMEKELKQLKVHYGPETAEKLLVYLDWEQDEHKGEWKQAKEQKLGAEPQY